MSASSNYALSDARYYARLCCDHLRALAHDTELAMRMTYAETAKRFATDAENVLRLRDDETVFQSASRDRVKYLADDWQQVWVIATRLAADAHATSDQGKACYAAIYDRIANTARIIRAACAAVLDGAST